MYLSNRSATTKYLHCILRVLIWLMRFGTKKTIPRAHTLFMWKHEKTMRPVEIKTSLRTLFISERDGLQCYSLRCNQSSLKRYISAFGVHVIGAVPSILKWDASLVHRPNRTAKASGKSTQVQNRCFYGCHVVGTIAKERDIQSDLCSLTMT